MKTIHMQTPLDDCRMRSLNIGDKIIVSGYIYTGRDVALPQLVQLIENQGKANLGIDLEGAVFFHTAVSPAGIGPTSSNKLEIEENIVPLSRAGVKLHMGKGALRQETVELMSKLGSAYAVVPPVSALLSSRVISKRVLLFPEAGIEAVHLLEVDQLPAVVVAVNGESLLDGVAV